MIVQSEQDAIQRYLRDASNMPGGAADTVYIPESEGEIVELLAEASRAAVPVTVSGAGTGLAGARTPMGGYVVSLERLNRIRSIDVEHRSAVVEPCAVLGDFQREVESLDLFYPPDPTERNCCIGGTLATNASGARTFKYGPTREYVTGLRVVLATGELLVLKRGRFVADGRLLTLETEGGRRIEVTIPGYTMPNTKHAAGYFARPGMDAVDLFIGSEGTLGVFTEIELRLIPLPEKLFSGVVFFPNETSTLAFVEEARRLSMETRRADSGSDRDIDARALEYIDANALDFVRDQFPTIPEDAAGGAIWFEQEINDETEEKLLEEWYELILRHGGLAEHSWFAVGAEDQRRLREFRHAVPSAVYEYITEHGQTKLGTDMAVPDGRLPELLGFYREQFERHALKNIIYGHIGNNHLHANVFTENPARFALASRVYHELVMKAIGLGGTVSAEHGVGKIKKKYLAELYGAEGVEEMRAVKRALDPVGILGVGTMFDL